MTLEIAWYAVLGLSMLMYALLDGFDLGVGILHLFAKEDEDRRIFLRSIGPVWDGNEVWIVIIMGALFAGFPNAYATLFSGFYTLLMALIAGLVFRAAALEFRSKVASQKWQSLWDWVFAISSFTTTFTIGLVFGNLIAGAPINAVQECSCSFALFFRPYALLIAVLVVFIFALHGGAYLYLKTEGRPQSLILKLVRPIAAGAFILFCSLSVATVLHVPRIAEPIFRQPLLGFVPALAAGSFFAVVYFMRRSRGEWAFFASCTAIGMLLLLFCIGTFPLILYSSIDPDQNSLTIYNTASSPATLKILLTIVAIGVPLVLAYGWWIYRMFRGKITSSML